MVQPRFDSARPFAAAGNPFDPSSGVIRKRDGQTVQPFDVSKIRKAVGKAWVSEYKEVDAAAIEKVVDLVLSSLEEGEVTVEDIQDRVELALMRVAPKVAKHYILYREDRAQKRALRDKKPDPKAVGDYIHASKYARYQEALGRREVYDETVDRDEAMHITRFPHLRAQIREAFAAVRRQEVLPSMRSMQFAGPAILSNHCKMFNCCFSLIDRFEAFSEGLYLLLCGCGVGYSVQNDHVEKLPPIGYVDKKKIRHHVVGDTIEGWADTLKELLRSYQDGVYIEFAYHLVRDAGSPLKTSGGRAPGHTTLKKSLEMIRGILDGAQGRQLRPAECHRIMCIAAEAPLSGGVRRSAMIALFSFENSEMMDIKASNDWYDREPYLANANNSVVLLRKDAKHKQFRRILEMTKKWGEPGFYFTNDINYGTNPCSEIGLDPRLVIDDRIKAKLAKKDIQVSLGDVFTGYAFCNLTTINAAKLKSLDDFMAAARAATFIGTLQATYTAMPYLGWVSETIAERDALLGVSMTGVLDAPLVACNPDYQRKVAMMVKQWNREFADLLGIEPAARTTCIKPEGTSSLELGGVGSGHHAHHARRYIRRVIADELEIPFQTFREANPHMCVRKPDGKFVIEFPVEAPVGAVVKKDLSAIQFLDMVRSTQQNWVLPGTAIERYSPGLAHNVSNTVHVQADEWGVVADYLFKNREELTGIALLPATADKEYAYAPNEEVTTEADEVRWNNLIAHYKAVDYTAMREGDDRTSLRSEAACAGGSCEVSL
jgi:ribonucleoside-triphosphate reductase (thioredoxin)